MRIALLSPAGAMHRYNGSFGRALHYAPLTLTTLAALVPPSLDATASIYDETVEGIPLDLDADLIGITVITGTAPRAYRYADYFRGRGIPVVLGGVHPTLLPEEAALHADSVVVGLADRTWPRLLEDFVQGKMKRIYRQDGQGDGPERLNESALSGRPIPRRDLLKAKGYITTNTVEAVRGCNLACSFCVYPQAFGQTVYKRPVREVLDEIERLPGKIIAFPDVNLMADREYAKDLFTGMISLRKWWLGLTTSSIGQDDEMIRVFQKSGCKGLLIGFESVSQESQKFVRKGVNRVGEYGVLMRKLHDAGIAVNGCFAFGADDEDKSIFERTVEAVVSMQIDLPRYSILTPFPKTQFYKDLMSQGRIIEHDWAMYDVEHCVFRPMKMTPDELEEGLEWAWRQTYSLGSIASRLSHLGTILPVSLMTNLAYRRYADRLSHFTGEVMKDNSDIPSPCTIERGATAG